MLETLTEYNTPNAFSIQNYLKLASLLQQEDNAKGRTMQTIDFSIGRICYNIIPHTGDKASLDRCGL